MNREKSYDVMLWCVLAAAFFYTLGRAMVVPVFHDEAATYLYLALLPYPQIMDYGQQPFAPNNHLLNTVLIKFFTQIFGVSEFVIRLPALIGHAIYLAAVYRICRFIASREIVLGGAVLLAFNPFVLELFSSARGYALGLGFFMAALCFFLRRTAAQNDEEIRRCLIRSSIMLSLAVMANFTFMQVYISFFLLTVLYETVDKVTDIRKKNYASLRSILPRLMAFTYSLAVIMIFCWSPMHIIRQRITQEPYLGGEQGFWQDTVMSLIQDSLYGQYLTWPSLVTVISVMVGLLSAAGLAVALVNRTFPTLRVFLTVVLGWIATTVLLMVFQWKILGIKYVVGRHAVFFVPLFMTAVVILWSMSQTVLSNKMRMAFRAGFWVIVVLAAGHFARSANLTQFYVCPYAASVKEMMGDLARLNQSRQPDEPKIKLSTHWLMTPMVNFYYVKNRLAWLQPLDYWTTISLDADFYYTFLPGSRWLDPQDDIFRFDLRQLEKLDLKEIKRYDLTQTRLLSKYP